MGQRFRYRLNFVQSFPKAYRRIPSAQHIENTRYI